MKIIHSNKNYEATTTKIQHGDTHQETSTLWYYPINSPKINQKSSTGDAASEKTPLFLLLCFQPFASSGKNQPKIVYRRRGIWKDAFFIITVFSAIRFQRIKSLNEITKLAKLQNYNEIKSTKIAFTSVTSSETMFTTVKWLENWGSAWEIDEYVEL